MSTQNQKAYASTHEAQSLSSDLQDINSSKKKVSQQKKTIKGSSSKNSLVGQKRSHAKMQEDPLHDTTTGQQFNEENVLTQFLEISSNASPNNNEDATDDFTKLQRIEKMIQDKTLSKHDRRLLQNKKSALKCRLKKENQLTSMNGEVEKLSQENNKLKEKVSAINALLMCKTEENLNLSKKYNDIQLQHQLLILSLLQTSQKSPSGTSPQSQASNSLMGGMLPSQMQQTQALKPKIPQVSSCDSLTSLRTSASSQFDFNQLQPSTKQVPQGNLEQTNECVSVMQTGQDQNSGLLQMLLQQSQQNGTTMNTLGGSHIQKTGLSMVQTGKQQIALNATQPLQNQSQLLDQLLKQAQSSNMAQK